MNTSRPTQRERYHWEIVFLLLLVMAVFCLAGGLLFQQISNFSGYNFLPVALGSVLETGYGLDPNPTRRPPLRLDIIWDTIRDHNPDANLDERKEVLLNKLQTPVPVVTPQACQGRQVIYATQDTWLDSAQPTNSKGNDLFLRLGFNDTGRKRILLYFPVSDRIPPGTFISRALLELDLPPDTPSTVPRGMCFYNFTTGFDETGTNWSNQPAAYLPYCPQAIPRTDNLHTWDVTELVNDWLQGRYPNSGLMIDLTSSAAFELVYLSREAASQANFQTNDPARRPGPRLIIDCGGPLPTPAVEVAQADPTPVPELPAATSAVQTPSIAATGTPASSPVPPTGSPPPASVTPPFTPVFLPTGTSAATATAPAPTSTRPVSTVPPTPPPVEPTSPPPEPTRRRAASTPFPNPTHTATAPPAPTATLSPTPVTPVAPEADLAVSKSASANPVLAGNNLTYTLNINNNGPAAATGVTVTDNLPPAVGLVSAVTSQGGGCSGTAVLTCALGDINPGGAASITVVVNVPAAATGVLTNSATVSAGQADPNPANNTVTLVTAIGQAAELSITKSDSPDPVAAGQTLTYTLSVFNNGPSNATGVTVSDTLPAGVAFVSASPGCSQAGGTVTCTIGSLTNGGSAERQVVVSVPTGATGILTNQAAINGNETDPNPANNTAVVTTTISTPAADLSITKSASRDSVDAGLNINYRLNVTNNGPANATGVVITDTLPLSVTVIAAPGCAINGNIIICPVDAVSSGQSAVQIIEVNVDPAAPPGTITNTARVGGNEPDPTPANNTATVNTIITTSANLAASLSAEPEIALPGASLTYTIAVSNSGPSLATGAIITDTLPAEVSLTAFTPGCQQAGPQVVCNAGSLMPGGSAQHQVIVAVPATATGILTNQVVVRADQPDANPADNLTYLITPIMDENSQVVILTAVQDSWIDENNPGGKNGDAIELSVKPRVTHNDERRIVMEFDLSSIPGSHTVLYASLGLSALDAVPGQTIALYRLTSPWEEAFVSWNHGTQTLSWIAPGGDFDPAGWASFSPNNAGLRQVDVTALVQGWLNGAYPNYGLLLTASGSDGNVRFYSREAPAAGDRPTLTVLYTALPPLPAAGPTSDRTLGEGPSPRLYLPLIVK